MALPYLRMMFAGSLGMLLFFMLGGALRAAGDSRTPLCLGVGLTLTHIVLNIDAHHRRRADSRVRRRRRGRRGRRSAASLRRHRRARAAVRQAHADLVLARACRWRPDWTIIRSLFRFGLPTGLQGVAMNVGGVLLLRFIGGLEHSAEAQAAYAVGYTQLFSLITWTSVGLMGAAATVAGQNLGAGQPDRAVEGVWAAARIGLLLAGVDRLVFLLDAAAAAGALRHERTASSSTWARSCCASSAVSGLFVTLALVHTGGLQGTGDTRSPLFISLVSQVAVPLGLCLSCS